MLDVHIDDFFKDCSTILLLGFRRFPRTQTLFVEDISGPDEMDEFGLHSNRHLAALGALQWLKEEGYVRFGVMDRQLSVDDFVLTSRSLSRLLKPIRATQEESGGQVETTPVIQVLEFARLQSDTTWMTQIMQQHVLQHI
ncbi:MAG: hypothetical protein K6L60_04665 [Oceanobacter sp.]|jgi:hypothetical protein